MSRFIGIALASALHLPINLWLAAFLVLIGGLVLWGNDHRALMIWISVILAIGGALWFTIRLPHFDQNSLSTYNGNSVVTIEGVIDADPDVRDSEINLRVNTEFHYGDRARVTGQLTALLNSPTSTTRITSRGRTYSP